MSNDTNKPGVDNLLGKIDGAIAFEKAGLNELAKIAGQIRDGEFAGGREIALAITKLEESLHRLQDTRAKLAQQ